MGRRHSEQDRKHYAEMAIKGQGIVAIAKIAHVQPSTVRVWIGKYFPKEYKNTASVLASIHAKEIELEAEAAADPQSIYFDEPLAGSHKDIIYRRFRSLRNRDTPRTVEYVKKGIGYQLGVIANYENIQNTPLDISKVNTTQGMSARKAKATLKALIENRNQRIAKEAVFQAVKLLYDCYDLAEMGEMEAAGEGIASFVLDHKMTYRSLMANVPSEILQELDDRGQAVLGRDPWKPW